VYWGYKLGGQTNLSGKLSLEASFPLVHTLLNNGGWLLILLNNDEPVCGTFKILKREVLDCETENN